MATETVTPPRPFRNAPSVMQAAAKLLAPDVMAWAMAEGEQLTAEDDLPGIEKELVAAFNRVEYKGLDGYDLAKELEFNCGYSPDAYLVEILDRAGFVQNTAHNEAVKNWVMDNKVFVPFKIGDQVYVSRMGQTGGTPALFGRVNEIHAETASVTVTIPEMNSSQRVTVPFELCSRD